MRVSWWTRRRAAVAVLACACAAMLVPAGSLAASVPAPADDSFYSYSGSLGVPPGTVLKSRVVQIAAAGVVPALSATQVLYRSTTQLGQPDAAVATIIRPLSSVGATKLLSYQTFYDGIASTCRPSYTLQGGDPGNTTATLDETFLLSYVAQGYTVVSSDYEGLTDDYGAGRQSGQATLDGIRAAEHQLKLPAETTPVGLVGYSGGAIASEWASELAPTYAPDLDLIGVAEGGIPADFNHNLAYIDGSSDWAGAMPAILIGLARAYHVDLDQYLSAYGESLVSQVEQGCLNPSAYPGLTFAQLFKPQYADYEKVPILVKMFNASIMGRSSTPKGPLLMGVGDADGTGDGVMIDKDVQQLAYEYCQRGVSVQFNLYPESNHDVAAVQFEPQALAFMAELYNGVTPSDGCHSITSGNPLTPLPDPATTTTVKPSAGRLVLRVLAGVRRQRVVRLRVSAALGAFSKVTIDLRQGGVIRARAVLARVTARARVIALTAPRRLSAGRYTLTAKTGTRTLLRRTLEIKSAATRTH